MKLRNCFAFVVEKSANKVQIKKAVEAAYGVTVNKVRTVVHPAVRNAKNTKKGLVIGVKDAYKKAFIQVEEGEY